jgi:hypothetical protein
LLESSKINLTTLLQRKTIAQPGTAHVDDIKVSNDRQESTAELSNTQQKYWHVNHPKITENSTHRPKSLNFRQVSREDNPQDNKVLELGKKTAIKRYQSEIENLAF